MKNIIATSLITLFVFVNPVLAMAQQDLNSADQAAAYAALATGIPLGARIKLQARGGRRLTATLMSVSATAIVVQRDARVPEPPMTVAFTELVRLQRDERQGFTIAKAIGVGLAAGVGAILTIFAIAVSIGD